MSEKLSLDSCGVFTEKLASRDAVPGGGGAAALMGALGAALCAMAGNLTLGKKKYAAYEEDLRRMIAESESLRERFVELIDADAAAFEPLSRAYSKPKTDPDYAIVLREATLRACSAPHAMMEACCKAIELLEEIKEKCSVLMISDVGCGARAAGAALEAAAMNVLVNTRLLPGDAEAEELENSAEEMLRTYSVRAQSIAAAVLEQLRRKNRG